MAHPADRLLEWNVVMDGALLPYEAQQPVRPPLRHWLLYRLFDKRVPYPYRFWVRHDVRSRWFLFKHAVGWLLLFPTFFLALCGGAWLVPSLIAPAIDYVGPPLWLPPAMYASALLGRALTLPRMRRRIRRDTLRKHDFHEDGAPVVHPPPSPFPPPFPPPAPGWRYR